MFSFLELNDDQRALKESVDRFVKEEVIPVAAKYDQSMEFPWDVIKKAHANGFMNLDIPSEYGGMDMDLVSNALIAESFGYGCTGIGTALNANDLASTPLILAGSDDIKKRFLTRLTEEPLVAVSFYFILLVFSVIWQQCHYLTVFCYCSLTVWQNQEPDLMLLEPKPKLLRKVNYYNTTIYCYYYFFYQC